MIKLFHGSNTTVEVPDLLHSKPFKDFGRGFLQNELIKARVA